MKTLCAAFLVLTSAAFAKEQATIMFKAPDRDITLAIDGEEIKLAANKVHKAKLDLGEHIVEAVSADGFYRYESTLRVGSTDSRVVKVELEPDLKKLVPEVLNGKMEARVLGSAPPVWVLGDGGEGEGGFLVIQVKIGSRAKLTGREDVVGWEAEVQTQLGSRFTGWFAPSVFGAEITEHPKSDQIRTVASGTNPLSFYAMDRFGRYYGCYVKKGTTLPLLGWDKANVRIDWERLDDAATEFRTGQSAATLKVPADAYESFWMIGSHLEFVPVKKQKASKPAGKARDKGASEGSK